jgi:ATP-dependent DNA ligase
MDSNRSETTHMVEVSFVEWTRDGNLRRAAFVAMREDKLAHGVHRET